MVLGECNSRVRGVTRSHVYYSLVRTSSISADILSQLNKQNDGFVALDAEMVRFAVPGDLQICGLNCLLVACMKALNRKETGKKFISGNVNREIAYSLSP